MRFIKAIAQRKKLVIIICFLLFLAYLGWIKARALRYDTVYPLAVKWEGLYKDKNFRDIGASINACLGEEIMREGLVFRANGWFSGWSCQEVGQPENIFSLNFDPAKQTMSYCWDPQQQEAIVGAVHNPGIKLHDLEFVDSWKIPEMKRSACSFFREIFLSLRQEKRTLIHCDAGRDRSGLYSALLASIAAEHINAQDNAMLKAIECDYRKTKSLTLDKYGRMERFIRTVSGSNGSVTQFLAQSCQIPLDSIGKTAQALLAR